MKVTDRYLEGLKTVLMMGNRTFERKTVKRLIEHIEEIEAEKAALLQHIECEVDRQKPVVIPLEVADAIEQMRVNSHSNYTIIDSALRCVSGFTALNNWVASGRSNKLMSALINGYTVETLESRIEAAVLRLIEERSEKNVGYIIANDSEEFSQRITEIVTKIIREDQAIQ